MHASPDDFPVHEDDTQPARIPSARPAVEASSAPRALSDFGDAPPPATWRPRPPMQSTTYSIVPGRTSSMPPSTRASAPPATRTSAPPATHAIAPPSTRTSAPPATHAIAPPATRTSAPPAARAGSRPPGGWTEEAPTRVDSTPRLAPPTADVLTLAERNRIEAVYARLTTLTHYDILGVSRGATLDELRRARDERAIAHHPDRYARVSLGTVRRKLEVIFACVNDAYALLSNPDRRAAYDATLAAEAALATGEHPTAAARLASTPPVPARARSSTRPAPARSGAPAALSHAPPATIIDEGPTTVTPRAFVAGDERE